MIARFVHWLGGTGFLFGRAAALGRFACVLCATGLCVRAGGAANNATASARSGHLIGEGRDTLEISIWHRLQNNLPPI
ncbi:hypothetical protein [Fulvimarina sp. MAC3]|uniref:hypothetical protein n=1 Tax=Fulvimarina sp. MAC3 TaxID=3148887 RepID=UPI0031FD2599